MDKKVKYINQQIKRKAIRMVKQTNTISRQVPKNIPVPLAALISSLAYESCACFELNCDCHGEIDCGCCYPQCECAPSMLSPTETETVSRTETVQVPQEYIETVTVEVPKMVQVPVEIEVPETVFETVTE